MPALGGRGGGGGGGGGGRGRPRAETVRRERFYTFIGFLFRDSQVLYIIIRRGSTPASCASFTGMPAQNDANILKPLVPNPH